ncbi:MAG: PQQ-dependent sugar dehydrogenase [Thermoleophilia bacterium]|nr:PQQ-dependent sugar dehydrogenase [Thermoleophilia bacterium]
MGEATNACQNVAVPPLRARAAALLASLVVIAGCSDGEPDVSPTQAAEPPDLAIPAGGEVSSAQVVSGLRGALLVTGRPGDSRLFVVEQRGLIHTIAADELESEPFLDLRGATEAGGERGLLGLAFHPEHETNGLLYVSYTDVDGTTRVVEFHADTADGPADPDSARELLAVEQPFANHNGGHVAFGPDGMLYIGLGDGGGGGDPEDHGQRLDTLLGSILRIDVDSRGPGGLPYAVPRDNPFVDQPDARPEIWAFGLRNPWRFSFDAPTGHLWIGDVGQDQIEEIDRILATTAGAGTNFGWNRFEGNSAFDPQGRDVTGGAATPPVSQYSHDDGCSVTGGHVYRGVAVPDLDGRYVFGDFCTGRIWTLNADGDPGRPQEITDAIGGPLANLTSFGVDNDGNLYAVTGDSIVRFTGA